MTNQHSVLAYNHVTMFRGSAKVPLSAHVRIGLLVSTLPAWNPQYPLRRPVNCDDALSGIEGENGTLLNEGRG